MDRQPGIKINNGGYSSIAADDGVKKTKFPDEFRIRVFNKPARINILVEPEWSVIDLKRKIERAVSPDDIDFHCAQDFDLIFNGNKYPDKMRLVDIHKATDFSDQLLVDLKKSDLKFLQEKLRKITGFQWEMHSDYASCNRKIVLRSCQNFDKGQMDKLVVQLFSKIPIIKEFSEITYGVPPLRSEAGLPFGSKPAFGFKPSQITIKSDNVKLILSTAAVGYAASAIAQAIRTVENSDLNGIQEGRPHDCYLGRLPKELRGHIAFYIGSELPPETAGRLMEQEIAHASNAHWNGFVPIEFIELEGVRQSIGATASVLLENSAEARKKAAKGEDIAEVEISNEGMVLKFASADYAQKFFHALEKRGYKTTSLSGINPLESARHGIYRASVTIRGMHEVKHFVEITCRFPEIFTLDLFSANERHIELKAEFFVNQLMYIGRSEKLSVQEKKDKAKLLIDNYLPRLQPAEAAKLKNNIAKLTREDDEGRPGPLLYLRQYTGLGSVLPGEAYSDKVGTYKTIMEKIDELIPKSS